MPQDNHNEKKLNLDIKADVAQGVYSNLAIISHSPTEFTLDFAQVLPGTENANVRSRIIMSPVHLKRLLSALSDNVEKYEEQFGPIIEPAPGKTATMPYDMSMIGKA